MFRHCIHIYLYIFFKLIFQHFNAYNINLSELNIGFSTGLCVFKALNLSRSFDISASALSLHIELN